MRPHLSSELRAEPVPWWVTAFGPTYRWLYPHRDDAEARRHAPFLASALRCGPGATVIDLGCGDGRYCRALAARGLRVTGIDLSDTLLDVARTSSPGLPGAPQYIRADLRALPFASQFRGAVSLFTSFGYFDEPDDDRRALSEAARVLKAGGRLVLDVPHADALERRLVPTSREERDGSIVTVRRAMDHARPGGPYVEKTSRIETPEGRPVATVKERVRLYAPAALDALLVSVGLEPEGSPAGNLLGDAFGPNSDRYVRTARKVGARV